MADTPAHEQSKRVLDNLHDVTITAAASGDALVFDGTAWKNGPARVVPANAKTADYTLVLADGGKSIDLTKGTAATVTIPPASSVAFPVGTVIEVWQGGAGQVTVAAGGGVTLRAPSGAKTAAQYAVVRVRKVAADTWVLSGNATT